MQTRLSLVGLLLTTIFCMINTGKSAGHHHPCHRPCVTGQPPMTCEYNFTVETYLTLSKACWDCPFNVTDCFRLQCVSGDGHRRPIVTINRELPGPAIEVCEGDRVVVWVTNELDDGATTSIHWHGMHQKGTPYMDGPAHITQCPIQPMETFRYEFVATPAGTHWYHSHSAMQLGDGAYGSFIVRQPQTADHNSPLYDLDLSDHVMHITDWMPVLSIDRYLNLMHDAYLGHEMSALINGRARNYPVPNTFNTSGSPLSEAYTPMAEFHVQKDKRYLFRLICPAQKCAFRVFFDDHPVQIVSTDGMPVSPVTVDSLIISPGERYDVIISADQPVDNYWIRAYGLRDCYNKGDVVAILKYDGADDANQSADPGPYKNGTMYGPLLDARNRPIYSGDGYPTVSLTDLNTTTRHVNLTNQPPDVTHYTSMTFLNNDNSKFNNKDLYDVKSLPGYKYHLTPVMDNITFRLPPVPLLSQPEDVQEAWFCNKSTVNHTQCQHDLCRCTHRLMVQHGQMVEVVLVVLDEEGNGHPMHLHGYTFYVLGMAEFPPPYTLQHVQDMDSQGPLPRKLINPPLKDTLMIPNHHYAIIRFRADNPGIWFFHCHIESHLMQGKAFVLQDGDVSDFPPLPDVFPRCGGYGSHNAKRRPQTPVTCEGETSRAPGNSGTCLVFVIVFLILAMCV